MPVNLKLVSITSGIPQAIDVYACCAFACMSRRNQLGFIVINHNPLILNDATLYFIEEQFVILFSVRRA